MTKNHKRQQTNLLSQKIYDEINLCIAKYPADQKQSAVMYALTLAQDENGGWLTTELMDAVADYLDMPAIAVYEVASFYSMYEHKPVGKHKICVCTNISCMVCGSAEVVKHLQDKLEIKLGETTEDNNITLKEVECLGACTGAPMMQIGEKYFENLTADKLDQIIDSLE